MELAIRDGRFQAGEADLSILGKIVARDLGLPPGKVQFSVIQAGSFLITAHNRHWLSHLSRRNEN